MSGDLYRIVAPHFVAGVIVEGGRIVVAAPILRWSVRMPLERFAAYCKGKRWGIEEVPRMAYAGKRGGKPCRLIG
jgi:hypothetical protein